MNNENFKNSHHITYKEYQKKVTKNPNEGIVIFVSAFFVLLLLFLGIAKQISPEVDVAIGDNNLASEELEKNTVDDRLKLLQMEDEGKNDMFSPELDEKVVIPEGLSGKQNLDETEEKEEAVVTLSEKEATPKPQETASPAPKQVVETSTPAKVVVGYYSTKEQAEVAKGIIAESGLNISPFVKNIGGAYTIQIGSYSSREKAQTVVDDLLRNNYPARIILE